MSCTVFKSTNAVDQKVYAFPPTNVSSLLQVKRNPESATGAIYDFKYSIRGAGPVTFKSTGGTLSITGGNQALNEITVGSDTNLTFTLEEGRDSGYIGWTSNLNIIGLNIGKGAYPNYILGLHSDYATSMFAIFSESPLFNQPLNNVDVSNVNEFTYAFNGCKGFNKPLSKWDTSKGTNFAYMFLNAESFNQPIDHFKMSNAVTLFGMLTGARNFNQPLNSWDVSKVTDFGGFLNGASSFNQPLTNWNTASGTNFMSMFIRATSFNQPIDHFKMSNAVTVNGMLSYAINFNQPLNSWDVSKVSNFGGFLNGASSFNQPLTNWNTASATIMDFMFAKTAYNYPINFNTSKVVDMRSFLESAKSFNQPINIDVGMCKQFGAFFLGAIAFNQDISNWNIRSGENFSRMFEGASAFDQDLSKWCNKFNVQSAVFGDMLNGSGISTANYDKFLNALWLDVGTTRQSEWANRSLSKFLYLAGKKYSQAGAQARSNLIAAGWSITDGGQA